MPCYLVRRKTLHRRVPLSGSRDGIPGRSVLPFIALSLLQGKMHTNGMIGPVAFLSRPTDNHIGIDSYPLLSKRGPRNYWDYKSKRDSSVSHVAVNPEAANEKWTTLLSLISNGPAQIVQCRWEREYSLFVLVPVRRKAAKSAGGMNERTCSSKQRCRRHEFGSFQMTEK